MRKTVSFLMLAVILTGCATAQPRIASEPRSGAHGATIEDCLDTECREIILALTAQSEADSTRIRELEIELYWSKRELEAGQASAVDRFLARWGFPVGAAIGVYVGANAAR